MNVRFLCSEIPIAERQFNLRAALRAARVSECVLHRIATLLIVQHFVLDALARKRSKFVPFSFFMLFPFIATDDSLFVVVVVGVVAAVNTQRGSVVK
jgi:hypothetical protein